VSRCVEAKPKNGKYERLKLKGKSLKGKRLKVKDRRPRIKH
jgi:hypothetical protein